MPSPCTPPEKLHPESMFFALVTLPVSGPKLNAFPRLPIAPPAPIQLKPWALNATGMAKPPANRPPVCGIVAKPVTVPATIVPSSTSLTVPRSQFKKNREHVHVLGEGERGNGP